MKQVLRVTGILMLLLVAGTTRAGNTDGMTATLTQVVQDKLSAFNREDVSGTLQNIHSRSPQYSNMQQALTRRWMLVPSWSACIILATTMSLLLPG